MKLIVSDASPLIVIAKTGLIPVLNGMVEEVIIPETVYAECTLDLTLPGAQAVRAAVEAGHIQARPDVARPDPDPDEELSGLDAGELAAIHLALALQCPVLMDERLGRQVARRRGLTVIGSAGLRSAPSSAASFPPWGRSSISGGSRAISCRRPSSRPCWSGLARLDRAPSANPTGCVWRRSVGNPPTLFPIVFRPAATECEASQFRLAMRRVGRRSLFWKGEMSVSATKILWGQVITVFAIVLATMWSATEWTAWRLGFQPELGRPWFELLHFPFYLPPAFFWWWYAYDAYAPSIFIEGAYIAASGGLIAAAVAIGMSVWRAREAKNAETYGSARWAEPGEIERAGLLGPDGVVLGRYRRAYLRHDGPEHVLCFAPTRSGKGVGLVIPSLLTWPGSAIVHDIKSENWQLTAGFRAKHGRVLLFDPTNANRPPTTRCWRSAVGSGRSATSRTSPTSWSIPKVVSRSGVIGRRRATRSSSPAAWKIAAGPCPPLMASGSCASSRTMSAPRSIREALASRPSCPRRGKVRGVAPARGGCAGLRHPQTRRRGLHSR